MFPCAGFGSGYWWFFPIMMALMFFICFFMMKRMSGRGSCGNGKHGTQDKGDQRREDTGPSGK